MNLVPTKMNFEIRKPKAEVFVMLVFYLCFLAMYKLCLQYCRALNTKVQLTSCLLSFNTVTQGSSVCIVLEFAKHLANRIHTVAPIMFLHHFMCSVNSHLFFKPNSKGTSILMLSCFQEGCLPVSMATSHLFLITHKLSRLHKCVFAFNT